MEEKKSSTVITFIQPRLNLTSLLLITADPTLHNQMNHVCFLAAIVLLSLVTLTSSDNCFECTTKIKSSVDIIRTTMFNKGPIPLKTPEPCRECNFSGIDTIQNTGDVCSLPVDEAECGADRKCFTHKLRFAFTYIEMKCVCQFPTDPQEMVKLMQDKANNPEGEKKLGECASGRNMDNVDTSIPDFMKQTKTPQDVPRSAACAPKGMTKPPEKVGGTITAKWNNFLMDVVLQSCIGEKLVTTKSAKMGDMSLDDMSLICGKGDPGFDKACECFGATDMAAQGFTKIVDKLFPCYGEEEEMENHNKLLKLLECTDIVEKEEE